MWKHTSVLDNIFSQTVPNRGELARENLVRKELGMSTPSKMKSAP